MRLFRYVILLLQSVSLLVFAEFRFSANPEQIVNYLLSHATERPREIRKAFLDELFYYLDYAYPNGSLPLRNGSFVDDKLGWNLPVVEATVTAIVMQEPVVGLLVDLLKLNTFYETKEWNMNVSVGDASSHVIGPLLSMFDLFTGMYRQPPKADTYLHIFVTQAESLAESFLVAFDTPFGIPDPVVNLYPTTRRSGAENTTLHDMGSLFLEWVRLSDISGAQKFARLVETMGKRLQSPRPRESQPFQGLLANRVNLSDSHLIGNEGGWNAESHGFYDSYIKMWVYDPIRFPYYKDWWIKSADSVIENLKDQTITKTHGTLLFLQDFAGNLTKANSSQLACAAGSSFIQGGMALQREKYVQFGLQIAETCWSVYTHPGLWLEARETKAPATISPVELVDVIYDAFRATDDIKWQDRSWELFQHLKTVHRHGFKKGSRLGKYNGKIDFSERMEFTPDNPIFEESNWLGRMLRTLWLMWAAPYSLVQIRRAREDYNANRFVYTTNRVPLQVFGWSGKDSETLFWKQRTAFEHEREEAARRGSYLDFKYMEEYEHAWKPESWEEFFQSSHNK